MRLEDFLQPNMNQNNSGIVPLYDSFQPQPLSFNQPIGLEELNQNQSSGSPLRETLTRAAKSALINYGANKIGLPAIGTAILKNTVLGNPLTAITPFAPLAAVSAIGGGLPSTTFGRSRNIAEYLRNKRAQKVAEQVAKRGETKQIQERLDREGGGGFKGEGGYGSSAERGAALHG